MSRAFEEEQEKEQNRRKYLVEMKEYKPCLGCGELIAPREYGYDVSMCKSCQEYQMRD